MTRALAWGVMALALAAAPALAETGGAIVTLFPVDLPAGSTVDASLDAAFCPALARGDFVTLSAPRAVIERHERTRVRTGPVEQYAGHAVSTFGLTDVVLSLERPAGWLGLASKGDARLRGSPGEGVELAAAPPGPIGNWRGANVPEDRVPAFAREVAAHLAMDAPIVAEASGDLVLKVYGSVVAFRAAENDSRVETGPTPVVADVPGAERDRWLVVRLASSTGVVAIASPCSLAASVLDLETAGTLSVPSARGEIHVGGDAHAVDGEPVTIEGPLRVRFAPREEGGSSLLGLVFEEDVGAASIGTGYISASKPGLAFGRWAAGGAILVLVASALAVGRARGRALLAPLTVEQCVEMADAAAAAGRYESALTWTRCALAQAPSSARLHMDQAWFLWELGQVDSAFRAAEKASALGNGGETPYLAALLFARAGEDARAATHLLRAIVHSPELALHAADEPAFQSLREVPDLARAIRDRVTACD